MIIVASNAEAGRSFPRRTVPYHGKESGNCHGKWRCSFAFCPLDAKSRDFSCRWAARFMLGTTPVRHMDRTPSDRAIFPTLTRERGLGTLTCTCSKLLRVHRFLLIWGQNCVEDILVSATLQAADPFLPMSRTHDLKLHFRTKTKAWGTC